MTKRILAALLRAFAASHEGRRYLGPKRPGRAHALAAWAHRTEAERSSR